MDAATGKQIGAAYTGFTLNINSRDGDKAFFEISVLDDKGENVKEVKTFTIDTSYLEKAYAEPQAVILLISVDMIELKPGAVLYNSEGKALLAFSEAIGPFRFIQKGDFGYMFTMDTNVVLRA